MWRAVIVAGLLLAVWLKRAEAEKLAAGLARLRVLPAPWCTTSKPQSAALYNTSLGPTCLLGPGFAGMQHLPAWLGSIQQQDALVEGVQGPHQLLILLQQHGKRSAPQEACAA